jgi:hypothetical protein
LAIRSFFIPSFGGAKQFRIEVYSKGWVSKTKN